jgi:hypothetical protein
MSRIHLTIDRLVLRGLQPGAQKSVADGLQLGLSQILSSEAARADWARSHRTPVLKLGQIPLGPGASGGREFGRRLARTIGKGLKP